MTLKLPDQTVAAIAARLHTASRVLVTAHIRPDGDAVGSVLGWGLSLEAAGKQVQIVLSDGVPSSFRHLEGADRIRRAAEGPFDLVCTLDCSDLKRVGNAIDAFLPPDLNIDHHITNEKFATINLVVPQAVATAEILAELVTRLGLPLTQGAAAALLTGLITDTLGFRTSNMTSHALRLAADLMDHGLDLPDLYRRVLLTRSFEATRMWGVGLGQIERKHGVAWTSLSQTDRTTAGYAGKDDADLINILAAIDDIDIAVVFVEQSGKPTEAYPEGHVKVSWRAQPGWDVSQLAVAFGGGGHPAASGADIPGGLDEVRQAVLTATFATLKNQRAARATTTPHEPTSPAGANGDQWTVTTT